MSLNGISTLSTKQEKQIAKLNLAESDRERVGNPRSAYDITRLPTQYSDNDIVDNPNDGGLVQGRPWVSLVAGVYQYHYNGNWNNDYTYMPNRTSTGSLVANNFQILSEDTSHSEWFKGYLLPDFTGTWTFSMYSDDYASLWIGPYAVQGYSTSNALINSDVATVRNTIDLVAGSYYPIMLMYGNDGGPGDLSLTYSHAGQSFTYDFTGKLFYNPITNGI